VAVKASGSLVRRVLWSEKVERLVMPMKEKNIVTRWGRIESGSSGKLSH